MKDTRNRTYLCDFGYRLETEAISNWCDAQSGQQNQIDEEQQNRKRCDKAPQCPFFCAVCAEVAHKGAPELGDIEQKCNKTKGKNSLIDSSGGDLVRRLQPAYRFCCQIVEGMNEHGGG